MGSGCCKQDETKTSCCCVEETEFFESLHRDWCQGFRVSNVIFREQTDVQDLIIFDNPTFGRVMALDGVIQITENDEFTYQEMMAHVPLFAYGNPKKVLIIGGGDGGILREVLRHRSVEKAVLVDIDRYVIELSKKYFPNIPKGAFDDPRSQIVVADGAEYVRTAKETFDVIITDSTDPFGPGEALFTEEFYGNCRALLSPDGILVNQNGVPFMQPGEIKLTYNRRLPYFKHVSFYTVAVPTYVGGMMALGWATNSDRYATLTEESLKAAVGRVEGTFKYYSPAIHLASFALPPYISKHIC